MAKIIKVSAPGKIILSGEHAVVYGYPAILAAVDRRLTVEIEENEELKVIPRQGTDLVKNAIEKAGEVWQKRIGNGWRVKIISEIPIGSGMGSSAAFAVAISAAFRKILELPWNLEEINLLAYELEKKQHGNPSGGDNTVSTYGGFLWYRKEAEDFKVFSPLKEKYFPQIFLINTGKPQETTAEMVAKVKRFSLDSPSKTEKVFRKIEMITRHFLKVLLGEESFKIKDLFKENEKLLEQLGVVSTPTRLLIRQIEKIGGAAKISGAGGIKENSGVILAYHDNPEILRKFSQKEKIDIMKVKLGEEGVRVEGN